MATITYDQDSPSKGGSGPLFGSGSSPYKVVTGQFAFDNSYPTGGESLSDIFDFFNSVTGVSRLKGIIMEQPIIVGAQTGKFLKVDYTAKKVLLYTNASPYAEVANGSDQSAITGLRFIAWGAR
jgi:hypothetical protein